MNNRWIYAVELIVFGAIALRGGWVAFRAPAAWARVLGLLAMLAAGVSVAALGAFLLNVHVPVLLHTSALVGTLLVVVHQTGRVAESVPGFGAVLLGLYGALSFVVPHRRPRRRPPPDEFADEEDDDVTSGTEGLP